MKKVEGEGKEGGKRESSYSEESWRAGAGWRTSMHASIS